MHRYPAGPTAPNKAARTARFGSQNASPRRRFATQLKQRPSQPLRHDFREVPPHPHRSAPSSDEPVVETNAARRSAAGSSPTVGLSPNTRENIAGSTPHSRPTRSASFTQAIEVSDVFSGGYQSVASPQTAASALSHAHTATGKLNAKITPTTSRECHYSIIRYRGRSLAIVRPRNCRDNPVAISQMSINT